MTNEIPQHQWKVFFDAVSKNYSDWETKVEVISRDFGAQVLSSGLPLLGFIFENKNNALSAIEMVLGKKKEARQTHTISKPRKVFFKVSENNPSGIIEIEEANDVKTLIYLIQPRPVLRNYLKFQLVAAL